MKVLFIVTARGGSKGVPRKNVTVIGKHSLIGYKIISAQKCKYDKRIIVSTDDDEIAEIAKNYGADVPFIRPSNLATSTASSMDVVMHAMKWIEENDDSHYDYVCLMEPSSPFLYYTDIDRAFSIMMEKQADTLLGVKEVEVSRNFIYPLDANGGLSLLFKAIEKMSSVRRQDQPKEYTPNGCIYAARWDYLVNHKMFHSNNSIAYIMPEEQSVEIDTPFDLLIAQTIVDNRCIDLSMWD